MSKEEVKKVLEGKLLEMGYELYDLSYAHTKEGDALYIVVDRPTPISLNDIVLVSETLSPILDELDPFDGAYTLDVSSLGSEKPIKLEKLSDYIGQYVHLHLSHPYKGENDLEGHISAVDNDTLTLKINLKGRIKEIPLPLKDIDKARLAIEF